MKGNISYLTVLRSVNLHIQIEQNKSLVYHIFALLKINQHENASFTATYCIKCMLLFPFFSINQYVSELCLAY